jgi:hypothetical protein
MTDERFELKIATVAGKYPGETASNTLTFAQTDTDAQKRITDYSWEVDESYPMALKVTFDNWDSGLTSGSYDATLNTGTLIGGLEVQFSMYPTLTSAKTRYFHGQIVSIKQTAGGLLEVECQSALAKLGRIIADFYWAASYREEYERLLVYAAAPTWPARIDTLDTGWVAPPLFVSLCLRHDIKVYSSARTSSVTLDNATKQYAQPFSGKDGDHINKWHISVYGGASNTASLRVGIQECDALTGPSGTWICYYDWTTGLSDATWFDCAWYPDNDTGDGFKYADRLRPDKGYALVVKASGTTTTVDIQIGTDGGTFNPRAWYYNTSWVEQTYNFAAFALEYSPWKEMNVSQAYANASYADEMWIDGQSNDIPDTNSYYERACVTYFYGTVTKKAVLENLINLVFGTSYDAVSSSISDTFGIYRTAGKTPLECIQQICDLEEAGLSNRQLMVYDYWSGGYEYICVRPRIQVTDASAVTFSDSGTTDTEHRILDYDLKKANPLKVNTVVVIGESADRTPIYASAVDWTSRALFGPVEHRVTDKNLREYAVAQSEATRILAAINRTDWEGTITVGGCYPDLMYLPVAPAATTNCGGKVITVNIGELGLSSTFCVRSVKCMPGQTILSITNYDYSKDDELEAMRMKSRLAENFSAAGDLVYNYHLRLRHASAVTTTILYAELQTAAGAAISGQTRVRCTKTSVTFGGASHNIYAATFMPGNGYTVSGTPIGQVVLYDAATLGTAVATIAIQVAERPYKLKVTRLMLEVHTDV